MLQQTDTDKLVAKGYTEISRINKEETFAPKRKMNTVRIAFSLATHFDWHMLDVKDVFLHEALKEV